MNTYARYIRRLKTEGLAQNARGLPTVACFNNTYTFTPETFAYRAETNPVIGFIELLEWIGGIFDKDAILAGAPKCRIELFSDQSAYGPRTVNQFIPIIDELTKDRFSRRAVIMIAHAADTATSRPCTLSLQFHLRDKLLAKEILPTLLTTVTMRSSDAVWGLPYDMIQFGGVAKALANCLGVFAGPICVNMGNAHIYDSIENLTFSSTGSFVMPRMYAWQDYVEWARDVITHKYDGKVLKEMFRVSYPPIVKRKVE